MCCHDHCQWVKPASVLTLRLFFAEESKGAKMQRCKDAKMHCFVNFSRKALRIKSNQAPSLFSLASDSSTTSIEIDA